MFKEKRCYTPEDGKMNFQNGVMNGDSCMPVCECPQERVCHREFVHNVQHVVPINTRIINHHVYKHSYMPCYTYCEENTCCDVYDSCPRF